jgi:DNA-directed RNA polymerase specialized sigma24 family protein
MSVGGLESDLEELYRRRQDAFQVMLASVTGSVESARDVVQEAFAQALRDQDGFRGQGSLEGLGLADRVPGRDRLEGIARARS